MGYEAQAAALFSLFCRKPKRPNANLMEGFRGQYVILRCLREHGGEMFAGDLAQTLCITTGRVATAIKRLEAMGMVCKRKDEADGRKTAVRLCPAGAEALAAREAQVQAFLAARLERLTEDEAAELVRLIQKMHS